MKRSVFCSLGLMSGTSCDGVDAALLFTDGLSIHGVGDASFFPYPLSFQKRLRELTRTATEDSFIEEVLIDELTSHHIHIARTMTQRHRIDLIGCHGQTVFHQPKNEKNHAQTRQIIDAQRLSDVLRIPVIADFRHQDIQNGGEGAPLVPLYHQARLGAVERCHAIVNIGGVCNITLLFPSGEIWAGDIGPGGALLDDWILEHTGKPYDEEGRLSLSGKAKMPRITEWLTHPFFQKPLPKSLDRNTFSFVKKDISIRVEDGAATLSLFTVEALVKTLEAYAVNDVILCGGGRHNPFYKKYLSDFTVSLADEHGWRGDSLEAEAFAFLAVRSYYGDSLSLPTTTGCLSPTTGGVRFSPSLLR